MLLNEFLKEHREVQEQRATNCANSKGNCEPYCNGQRQASQIQKVSAQLEASKPAPQVVNNP